MKELRPAADGVPCQAFWGPCAKKFGGPLYRSTFLAAVAVFEAFQPIDAQLT